MPTTETCTHCQSEITPFEQAYLVNGKVVCQLCNERLLQPPDVVDESPLALVEEEEFTPSGPPALEPAEPEAGSDFDLPLAKKRRKLYLTFFVLMVIGNGVTMAHPAGVLLYLPCLVAFMCYFLSTTKLVLGYSTGKLVAMGAGLFIPGVSLIVLLCIDTTLYKQIREREHATPQGEGPREFCSMGLYAFLLIPIPIVGLPLAIFAMRRIKKSDGRLYGNVLALIALILNAIYLGLIVFVIIMAILDDPANATG